MAAHPLIAGGRKREEEGREKEEGGGSSAPSARSCSDDTRVNLTYSQDIWVSDLYGCMYWWSDNKYITHRRNLFQIIDLLKLG